MEINLTFWMRLVLKKGWSDVLLNSGLSTSQAVPGLALVSPGVRRPASVRLASHSLARLPSNLESSNLAWISHLGGRWKFQLIFFRDSCHQLSTADNSCQKLMKIKINLESWNLAKISPIECTWKFQSNIIHISCHQLSTAVNSWWQLIKVDEIKN